MSYELTADARGRPQAERIGFVGDRPASRRPAGRSNIPPLFAFLFLVFLTGVVLAGRLPSAVLGLYVVASALAFVAYALDKSAAVNDRWRTQESTVHLFGLIGGWPGALAAQRLLRHKSKKSSFQGVFWATVALNCGVLGWLLSPTGAGALRSLLGAL